MIRIGLPRRLMSQLMLLTASALLIVIGLYAGFTLHQQKEVSRLGIETQVSALVRNLAVASTNPIVLGSLDTLDDLLERTANHPDLLELRVIDAEGRTLSHVARSGVSVRRVFNSSTLRLVPPTAREPLLGWTTVDTRRRMVAWHPVEAGSPLGWVRADFSDAALEEIDRRILLTTVIAAVLAVAGSSLLLFAFLRRPMRALERARRFAVGLDQANGRTLPMEAAPMEIEDMGAALNFASAKLNEQRQQLAQTIEQLQVEERVIRDRTDQLNTVFSLSPDGLVSFDGEDKVKFANPAFLAMTGLLAMDVVGLSRRELEDQLRRLADVPERWEGLDPCFAGQQVTVGAGGTVAAGRGRSHRLSLRWPQGAVLDLVGVTSDAASVSRLLYVRDVTHEVEVDRMKSEFLSHAAHELRTPMASIFGFSELLMTQEFDEATRQDLLETIHKQTAWLVDIINELLDLARIESRRGKDFRIETAALPSLLDEAVAALRIDPLRWPLTVELTGCPPVRADAAKLRQALTNVLGNAVKYSPAGGAIEIRYATRERDGRVFVGVAVTDHGIGMSPQQVARVCERFYRADTSGKIPGTGLGMAIVKEIVDLHGGELELASKVGAGTTVTIWLPATGSAAGGPLPSVLPTGTGATP